jgi:hypothetical protein
MRSASEEVAPKNTLRWGNTGAFTSCFYPIVKAGHPAEIRSVTEGSQSVWPFPSGSRLRGFPRGRMQLLQPARPQDRPLRITER